MPHCSANLKQPDHCTVNTNQLTKQIDVDLAVNLTVRFAEHFPVTCTIDVVNQLTKHVAVDFAIDLTVDLALDDTVRR